jgi:hypothetical protein|tara:strand:+ start:323 stop:769 length:447 start_codon:yes stop_codon:yes gene_type:complete
MEPEVVNIEQMEMKKVNYPNTLWSGGLGPCIGIGIYDPKTRSGYMMHEPHFQYVDLDDKIRQIQEDYGDLSRLKVLAAGNSLASDDDAHQRNFEKSNRPFVEQTLRKYFGNSQLQIRWAPDDYWTEMFLETSTGELRTETGSLDEMFG